MAKTVTVLNKYRDEIPADAINIMRGTILGNPYSVEDYGRARAIEKYLDYAVEMMAINPDFRARVDELRDREHVTLLCCCKPKACHGDVLARLILDEDCL